MKRIEIFDITAKLIFEYDVENIKIPQSAKLTYVNLAEKGVNNKSLEYIYADAMAEIIKPLAYGVVSKKTIIKDILEHFHIMRQIKEEEEARLLTYEPEGDSLYW